MVPIMEHRLSDADLSISSYHCTYKVSGLSDGMEKPMMLLSVMLWKRERLLGEKMRSNSCEEASCIV